jgi:hypothetical protein
MDANNPFVIVSLSAIGLMALGAVFNFVKWMVARNDRKKNGADIDKLLMKMAAQTNELHVAHLGPGSRDDEGRLRWWVRQSMVDAIVETRDELRIVCRYTKQQTRLMAKMAGEEFIEEEREPE